MSKLRVLDRSIELDLGDVFDDNSVHEVIVQLRALESKVDHGRGDTSSFRVAYGYEYTDVFMDVYRDETAAEYEARMLHEEKIKERSRKTRETKAAKARAILMATEEQERAEFERLKAKYDKVNDHV